MACRFGSLGPRLYVHSAVAWVGMCRIAWACPLTGGCLRLSPVLGPVGPLTSGATPESPGARAASAGVLRCVLVVCANVPGGPEVDHCCAIVVWGSAHVTSPTHRTPACRTSCNRHAWADRWQAPARRARPAQRASLHARTPREDRKFRNRPK